MEADLEFTGFRARNAPTITRSGCEDVCEAVVTAVGRPDLFARTSGQGSLVWGAPRFKPVAAMVCLGDNESEPEQEKFTA